MEHKDIVIISLATLVIFLYYQQNNQKNLAIQPSNQEIQDLKNQVVHYQTLYQKRVENDITGNQEVKINQLETELSEREKLIGEYKGLETNLRNRISDYEEEEKDWTDANQLLTANLNQSLEKQEVYYQKTSDLEIQLLNLARQKIKGKKDAEKLLGELENDWKQDKELWKTAEVDYSKKLSELNQDNQRKSRTIEGLNESYGKLERKFNQERNDWKTEKESLTQQIKSEQTNLTNLKKFLADLQNENKNFLEKLEEKEKVISKERQEKQNLENSHEQKKLAWSQELKVIKDEKAQELDKVNKEFIKEKEKVVNQKEEVISELEKVRKELSEQIKTLSSDNDKLKSEISETQKELESKEYRLEELKGWEEGGKCWIVAQIVFGWQEYLSMSEDEIKKILKGCEDGVFDGKKVEEKDLEVFEYSSERIKPLLEMILLCREKDEQGLENIISRNKKEKVDKESEFEDLLEDE